MKCFIKIISIFIFIGLLSGTAYSEVLDGYDKELLNTPQADEITLQPRSNTLFAGENSPAAKSVETKVIETKFVETKPVQTDNNILNDDNEVMNNNELEFEFFRMFDKDNDKDIGTSDSSRIKNEIGIVGACVRTGVRSFFSSIIDILVLGGIIFSLLYFTGWIEAVKSFFLNIISRTSCFVFPMNISGGIFFYHRP